MVTLKCKMCGGDIQIGPEKTYGTCDSCGSTMTLPRIDDERRANLFNRANHYRQLGDFDRAVKAYERILAEDDRDAEAHWGVVLSRFGIEYVEDPKSHERLPTCHRTQLTPVQADLDYRAALEHAPDAYSRSLYEQEAARIDAIQRRILEISQREAPYDVFICYKDMDNGARTPDSALAQDIYYELTDEGYKVFFARICLEDKLGQEYEPYIFAALQSARVMIVVGTQPAFFQAVWVKNEWSRFLDMVRQDRHKLLIPCYRNMDPYELPDELSLLQSLDMGRIGFIQDLIHGVKKFLLDTPSPAAPAPQPPRTPHRPTRAMSEAMLHLEQGQFDVALSAFELILEEEPRCGEAYWGKVLAKRQAHAESELIFQLNAAFDALLARYGVGADRAQVKQSAQQQALLHQLRQSPYLTEGDFWRLEDFFTGFHAYVPIAQRAKQDFLIEGALQNDPDFQKAVRFADLETQEHYLTYHSANEAYMDQKITEAQAKDDVSCAQIQRSYHKFVDDCIGQLQQLETSRRARHYRPAQHEARTPPSAAQHEARTPPKVGAWLAWAALLALLIIICWNAFSR